MIPTQNQLVLPLLNAIAEAGGTIRAKNAADAIAANIGMTDEERETIVTLHNRTGIVDTCNGECVIQFVDGTRKTVPSNTVDEITAYKEMARRGRRSPSSDDQLRF